MTRDLDPVLQKEDTTPRETKSAVPRERKVINPTEKGTLKVGMAQINNGFASPDGPTQHYLPYSTGFLQSYAQANYQGEKGLEFLLPIFKPTSHQEMMDNLSQADVTLLSIYNWNKTATLNLAKSLREEKPETVIIGGACSIPPQDLVEDYLLENPWFDVVCHGEGELATNAILERVSEGSRDFSGIEGISYVRDDGVVVKNPRTGRRRNLKDIPSPYLSGAFDALIEANPGQEWIGLWETNRGCPFKCSFCEWGGSNHNKFVKFEGDVVFAEADWFSENKIEYIFVCDANFGIQRRDLEIVDKVIANKKKYGYPHKLSVQNTKNSSDQTFELNRRLEEAGLSQGVNLAIQSLDPATLKAIDRDNIPPEKFLELQKRYNKARIITFTDLILGLPEETYNSFVKGVSTLMSWGQHNRIQFGNCSILPNAPMARPEYIAKYGLEAVVSPLVNGHGSLDSDEIVEDQLLITSTRALSPEDWRKTRAFAWMAGFLHYDKPMQIPLINMHHTTGVPYEDMIRVHTLQCIQA